METAPDWLWLLLLSGAIVLVAGLLIDFMLRRRAGAYRRSLWCGVWFVLVLLPALSAFTPRQFSLFSESEANEETKHHAPEPPETLDATVTFVVTDIPSITEGHDRAAIVPLEMEQNTEADQSLPWLLVVWGAGASLLLIRLMMGWCLLSWRIRRSRRVSDRELPGFLHTIDFLKLKRIPRVYASSQVGVPMCCGVLRPTILLPEGIADTGGRDTLELIFLHEGVYLQQKDALWLWLANLVVIVHWMNPLAWIAMARFRLAQEQTCDDVVLNRDCSATDYSTLLVTMAKGNKHISPLTSALTLAMARPSILKKRLRRILDPEMKRNKPNKIRRLITMMSLLTLAGAACTIGLRDSTAQEEPAAPPKESEEASSSIEETGVQDEPRSEAAQKGGKGNASQPAVALDTIILDEIRFENQPVNLAITNVSVLVNHQLEHGEVNFVLLKEAQTKTTNDLTRLEKLLEEEEQRLHQAQSLRDALALEYRVLDGSEDAESERVKQLLSAVSAAEQRLASKELLLSRIGHLDEEQKFRYLLRQESEETSLLRDAYQAFIEAMAANAAQGEIVRAQETFRAELEQHQKTLLTEFEIAFQELEALKVRHAETLQRALTRRAELSEYLRAENAYARAMVKYEHLENAMANARLDADEVVPVINLMLKNVSLADVLKYITQMADLKYLVQDSTVVIGTEDELRLFTEDLEPGSFRIR